MSTILNNNAKLPYWQPSSKEIDLSLQGIICGSITVITTSSIDQFEEGDEYLVF